MSATHDVTVVLPSGQELKFIEQDTVTLIDGQSHGPAAIGKIEAGETRLLICSPNVATVSIQAYDE